MNRILVISLLAVMLLQTFGKTLILMDYQANKAYISAFLCLNRSKPQLGCAGKCQLTQKLKEQEQAEKHSSQKNHDKEVQINLFCQALFSLPALALHPGKAAVALYQAGHPRQARAAIFHPPQRIV